MYKTYCRLAESKALLNNVPFLLIDAISESVFLGDVDESSDFQDEDMPMQKLAHLSSLNLQVSLNYLYCLIPCSILFSTKHLIDTRTQSFSLSQEQLDMLLLGSVASTVCDEKDYHYHVCRKTFTFLHLVSKHRMHAIKKYLLNNGTSTKEHGNTSNHPKHGKI